MPTVDPDDLSGLRCIFIHQRRLVMSNKVHPVTLASEDDAELEDPGFDVFVLEKYAKWRAWMMKWPIFAMDITNAVLSLVSCFDFVISTYNVVDNSAIDTGNPTPSNRTLNLLENTILPP